MVLNRVEPVPAPEKVQDELIAEEHTGTYFDLIFDQVNVKKTNKKEVKDEEDLGSIQCGQTLISIVRNGMRKGTTSMENCMATAENYGG